MIISETHDVGTSNDAGGISNNDTLNMVCAAGAGTVSAAMVGAAVVNAAAAMPIGAIYYVGLATIAGAGSYACVADLWSTYLP